MQALEVLKRVQFVADDRVRMRVDKRADEAVARSRIGKEEHERGAPRGAFESQWVREGACAIQERRAEVLNIRVFAQEIRSFQAFAANPHLPRLSRLPIEEGLSELGRQLERPVQGRFRTAVAARRGEGGGGLGGGLGGGGLGGGVGTEMGKPNRLFAPSPLLFALGVLPTPLGPCSAAWPPQC